MKVAVTLDVYEWHELLREMEHLLCIVNRDQSHVKHLYELIASQLGDKPVNVTLHDETEKGKE